MPTRRQFLSRMPFGVLGLPHVLDSIHLQADRSPSARVDLVIIGGGLGGCAAALAALQQGRTVVMTETTDWIGGQLTSQGVPPDEHQWIETHGANASYRMLRNGIRDYYRRHFPLNPSARADAFLNPGQGSVSRLCHEPRVALAVLLNQLMPYLSSRRLQLLLEHDPLKAELEEDRVAAVSVRSRRSGGVRWYEAPYFIDATELGDLLPLTKTEFTTGNEGREKTGELHAPQKPDPLNQQAFTCCFAMDHLPGQDHTIPRPETYDFWRSYAPSLEPEWPGRWLDFVYTHPRSGEPKRLGFNPSGGPHGGVINLWTYRRIASAHQWAGASDICLVNWPQNDYLEGPLVGGSPQAMDDHVERAKALSRSLLYWLQTEAPRSDGGVGYPGLRLRPDVMGTEDGMAKYPYVRESRRISARLTVTEKHCGREQIEAETGRRGLAARFQDSVAIGSYPIDLHPSTGGNNYIDFETLPFEVPLGALLPERVENVLPANKNIGTTHVTNGRYRLHPVEWGIGEAVGSLAAFCLKHNERASHSVATSRRLAAFQSELIERGVEIHWPDEA